MASSSVGENGSIEVPDEIFMEKCTIEVPIDNNGDPTPLIFSWQQTVSKDEGGGYGVIEFLKRVVDYFSLKDKEILNLTDEKNSKSYECELETYEAGDNEMFIAKGRFECLEDMRLKVGDKLFFTIENPSKKMFVYEISWAD